ncbi:hypothetical protein K3552_12510 [Leisingera aquaemixtae]|uniref:hypothetical protein n=1 Tax=Leisingera aquaemixtae TaxID=1396826 RepID=UPI0021A6AA88|nr:hypothetical protein [Leisingera aquaemixtae]UWQ36328.1 hypothetical protein K3552_12510 [Leisingera aquaemixtae]
MDDLESFQRDQSFMMTFAARDAPRFMFNISCVDHTVEDIRYLLLTDQAVWQVFGELRLAFQKPLDICLPREPTRGIVNRPGFTGGSEVSKDGAYGTRQQIKPLFT